MTVTKIKNFCHQDYNGVIQNITNGSFVIEYPIVSIKLEIA
jgi:hypothetical protein